VNLILLVDVSREAARLVPAQRRRQETSGQDAGELRSPPPLHRSLASFLSHAWIAQPPTLLSGPLRQPAKDNGRGVPA
jgi:hypothetical protein